MPAAPLVPQSSAQQQLTCSIALQVALDEAEAAAEGAALGGPGPQAAPGVVLLEDDPFERELAANDNSSMVETERDRLIRLVRHISCLQGSHG